MPRPVDKSETVDLHAPWWSAGKEPSGRYTERCVVRKVMSERNRQEIENKLHTLVRLPGGSGKGQSAAALAAKSEVVMEDIPLKRMYTLLEMIVEITDDRGTELHINKDLLGSFPAYDLEWIDNELATLYAAPSIEPTEEDEEAARMMREQAEYEGKPIPFDATPESQAVSSFRPSRKGAR